MPNAGALRLLAPDAPAEVADAERWLFLDTETTGLAGGTGTYPFLVGLAWWEGGGLEVEQLFMREYSEEPSLLAALAERLAERPVLVTFNGKSFDWPLLETRYRMARIIPPPVPLAHLDFLHPARSLWRLRLGSVRLSQLERHVLGWDRGADLASELIPRIYLDFVRGGCAEALVPVFHHNQMDLCGLAGLAGRILSLLADEETTSQDGLELYGVSRICERRGERARARKLYEQSIGAVLPRSKPIVPPAPRWRGWRSATETSPARANFGGAHWETLARATKLTSSWPSTMSMKPACRNWRWRSPARRSPSFAVRTRRGQSRRPSTAELKRASSIGSGDSNRRSGEPCSTPWMPSVLNQKFVAYVFRGFEGARLQPSRTQPSRLRALAPEVKSLILRPAARRLQSQGNCK